MFYKFVGGEGEAILEVFDKAVRGGSIKFASAAGFNDPFEFKFRSVAPFRADLDDWHRIYAPAVTPIQRENAWEALTGRQADWNSGLVPRMTLLGNLYILCLAQRWDNHLMWAHYTGAHQGFAICYKPTILSALEALADFETRGDVMYSDIVPELRWYDGPPDEILRPILLTKSSDWTYEAEHRVVLAGPEGRPALYHTVEPDMVAGVILGSRVSEALIERALAVRQTRPDFTVDQVSAISGGYGLVARRIDDDLRRMRGFL